MWCYNSSIGVKSNQLNEKIKRGKALKSFNFDNMGLSSLKILDNHHTEINVVNVFSAEYNKLNTIPKMFFEKIEKISNINFSFNEFDSIDEIIFSKITLINLNFSNNYIEKISPNLGKLINIKEINLSHNKIGVITNLHTLKNLEILKLNHNIIHELDESVILLPSLNFLDLGHNQISKLPNDKWDNCKIKILDMSNNNLSDLPINLLQKSNVSNLNLKGNQITKTQLLHMNGFPEFEKRRKERKDQGFMNNLDISFSLCGLE